MEGGEWYDNHYCTACNKSTTGKDVMFPDGYRLLAAGEKLDKHDEGLHEEDGKWHEIGWLFAQCHYVPGFMVPIRRQVSDPNAQVDTRRAEARIQQGG